MMPLLSIVVAPVPTRPPAPDPRRTRGWRGLLLRIARAVWRDL